MNINTINIIGILDGGSHKDVAGVENVQDSTNETTTHIPSTKGTTISALIETIQLLCYIIIYLFL